MIPEVKENIVNKVKQTDGLQVLKSASPIIFFMFLLAGGMGMFGRFLLTLI